MNKPIFKHVQKGDRPSAKEHNRRGDLLAAIANSLHIQGYIDSTGFHTRRTPGGVGVGAYFRSVKITGAIPSNNTGPFLCKLLNHAGDMLEPEIEVWPRTHLGAGGGNNFDGDVWPLLAVGDPLAVYKDVDGKWYFPFVFDDTTVC